MDTTLDDLLGASGGGGGGMRRDGQQAGTCFGRTRSDVNRRKSMAPQHPNAAPLIPGLAPKSFGRVTSDVTFPKRDSEPLKASGRAATDITTRRPADGYDVGVAGVLTPRAGSWATTHHHVEAPRATSPPRAPGRIRSDVTHPQNDGVAAIPATVYKDSVTQREGWHGRGKSNLLGAGIVRNTPEYGQSGGVINDYREVIEANRALGRATSPGRR